MSAIAHEFRPHDLVAGHAVLDFVNTVTAREAAPVDWLDGFERLVDWAGLAGLCDTPSLARVRAAAARSPRAAIAALGRARRLREGLHDTFVALIAGRAPPAHALHEFDAAWRRAIARARIGPVSDGLDLTLDVDRSGLDLIGDFIALEALALMRDFPLERTRVCAGPQCGWIFIDTSKGGQRVWCDMATCGNAAKGRRHRQRLQAPRKRPGA